MYMAEFYIFKKKGFRILLQAAALIRPSVEPSVFVKRPHIHRKSTCTVLQIMSQALHMPVSKKPTSTLDTLAAAQYRSTAVAAPGSSQCDSRLSTGSDDSGLLSTERLLEATTCAAMDFRDDRESPEVSLVVGRI